MLFRRECSKINRGPSCRCSIGEFWVLYVILPLRGVGAIMLFGGIGGHVYGDSAGGGGRR